MIGTLCYVNQTADIHAMTLTLEYMNVNHINSVSEIDHLSFDPPWPKTSYNFEINQSTISHMVVLQQTRLQDDVPPQPKGGLRGFIDGIFSRKNPASPNQQVIGYGGLWKIAEEAHVSTIAIHPDHRGHSYGEILLAGMCGKSIAMKAEYMVLEVRVSNVVAQELYRKYGFTEVEVKKNYYRNNNEDAYDMRLNLDSEHVSDFEALYMTLQEKQRFVDNYSDCPHPRLG